MRHIVNKISNIIPRICIVGIIINLFFQIYQDRSIMALMPTVLILFFLNSLYLTVQNIKEFGFNKKQKIDLILCIIGFCLALLLLKKQIL